MERAGRGVNHACGEFMHPAQSVGCEASLHRRRHGGPQPPNPTCPSHVVARMGRQEQRWPHHVRRHAQAACETRSGASGGKVSRAPDAVIGCAWATATCSVQWLTRRDAPQNVLELQSGRSRR